MMVAAFVVSCRLLRALSAAVTLPTPTHGKRARSTSRRCPRTSTNPAARSRFAFSGGPPMRNAAPIVAALNPPRRTGCGRCRRRLACRSCGESAGGGRPRRRRAWRSRCSRRSRAGRGAAAGGRAGRGGAARGGRGGAGGPANPIAALTAAIGRAPTLGYIWTNEITGYSIKYA